MASPGSSSTAPGIGGGSESRGLVSVAACLSASSSSLGIAPVCSSPGGPGSLPDSSNTGGRITSRLATIKHLLPTFRGPAEAVKVEVAEIAEGSRKRLAEPGLLGGIKKKLREPALVLDEPSDIQADSDAVDRIEESASMAVPRLLPLPEGWKVFEDSSLRDPEVAMQMARFLDLPQDRDKAVGSPSLEEVVRDDVVRLRDRTQVMVELFGKIQTLSEERRHLRCRVEEVEGQLRNSELLRAQGDQSREVAERKVLERDSLILDLKLELSGVRDRLGLAEARLRKAGEPCERPSRGEACRRSLSSAGSSSGCSTPKPSPEEPLFGSDPLPGFVGFYERKLGSAFDFLAEINREKLMAVLRGECNEATEDEFLDQIPDDDM